MDQSKKLSVFSIVFVPFATKISCVEDLLSENTCNWICKSESSGTDVKEFRKIMSQGKLMKLLIAYNERIDQACANETDATSNTTTFAEVWVKEIDASVGVIVSLSYTGLAEIYSGQFLLGGYKQQMNVSCVFKSTSRPGTNHPSPRLAFYTPDSVMYYVEQLSNVNSRNASFLTLIRTENQTRITVNVPSEDRVPSSSRREVNDNGDDNLQEQERAEQDIPLASRLDITDFTPRTLDSETRESAATHISREAQSPNGEHSEVVASARRRVPFKDFGEKMCPPSVHLPSKTTDDREQSSLDDGAIGRDEKQSRVTSGDSQHPASCSLTTDRSLMASASSCAEPLPGGGQSMQPFDNVDVHERDVSTETENNSNRSHGEAIDPYRTNSVEDLNANNTENVNTNGELTYTVDMSGLPDTFEHDLACSSPSTTNSSQQTISHETEETYARMIIVGGPCPVSFGSWIGNTFFSQLSKTLLKRWGKFILVAFLPFLAFTGLGDFMLVFLPKLDSRIGSYLPYHHLTGSMFYFLFNYNPNLLLLVLFSFICYFIRSVFVHGLISGKCPATSASWTTCFVHRRYFKCYVYKLVQSFLSQSPFPKSFCGWNSPCQGRHRFIKACHILRIVSDILHGTFVTLHPCHVCNNSPIKCPTGLEVPDNILHNLKELTNVFLNHYNRFTQCLENVLEIFMQGLTEIRIEVSGEGSWLLILFKIVAKMFIIIGVGVFKVIVSTLAVIILLVVDSVVLSSPLFCLCHGRRWILKESFKNRFPCSSFILPTLEIILVGFSLVWKVFFSLSSGVIMNIVIISSIKTLTYHLRELLPHFTVVILLFHYFWSCYSCFKKPFCDLVSKLFTSYRKKFDELEKQGGLNDFINYKQGEYAKLIPKELFSYACEHELICIRVRDRVAILLLKLVLPSLLLSFAYPAIHAQDSESGVIIVSLITFLASSYSKISDFVNKSESEVSEEDADKVVDDYNEKNQ